MTGSWVICDQATLIKSPDGRYLPSPRTLYMGVIGWTASRPFAMQFGFEQGAKDYIKDCERRHPNLMRGRTVVAISYAIEGEDQPVARVTADYDPFGPEAA